jgi:Bestrophin, RFP-TM, chloride channel
VVSMVFEVDQSRVEKITTQDLLDRILDESLRTSARRPIMKQFDPSSKAIWRHWRGTVLSETWKSACKHALWAVAVYALFKQYPGLHSGFVGCERVWSQILAITTFTLTFFVNEAYSCWRKCLNICYNIQGRLNDFSLAVASAARRVEKQDPDSSPSTYTPESRKILMIIARYIRLFNILSYAAITRSHRPLITPQGLRRMVSRGLLTPNERKYLISSKVTATSRHNEVLMWLFRTSLDAARAGHLDGGYGFEQNLFQRIQEIRAQGNYMSAVLVGRIPFAYIHIVQVLVDAVLWAYPFMAVSSGLSFQMGVAGAMLLTTTYQGLFDLAKRFLDPFHNENFWRGDDPIMVSTLIAETNAGSMRWIYGLEDMPLSMSMIKSGNVDDFVLPEEGYTVEEVTAREQQQKKEEAIEDEGQLEVEFEEAKAILNAPPGYDFVPGIDDIVISNSTDTQGVVEGGLESTDADAYVNRDMYNQFLETAAEEYELRENLAQNVTNVKAQP